MVLKIEDLRILKTAEAIADDVWREVSHWEPFAKDVVGKQFARAADSIGANIAESFGRYHYGERLQFLYYARGSLFETKYWVNRTSARNLLDTEKARDFAARLSELAHQLNAFSRTIKKNRSSTKGSSVLKESGLVYSTDEDTNPPLFGDADLTWLTSSNT